MEVNTTDVSYLFQIGTSANLTEYFNISVPYSYNCANGTGDNINYISYNYENASYRAEITGMLVGEIEGMKTFCNKSLIDQLSFDYIQCQEQLGSFDLNETRHLVQVSEKDRQILNLQEDIESKKWENGILYAVVVILLIFLVGIMIRISGVHNLEIAP